MIFFPGPNSFFCISPWRSWLAQMEKSSPAWQTSTGFLNLHLGKLFLSRSSFYFQELNCLQQSYRGNLISNMCLIDKCGLLFRINFANHFHLTGLPSLREVWKGSITKFLISSLLSKLDHVAACLESVLSTEQWLTTNGNLLAFPEDDFLLAVQIQKLKSRLLLVVLRYCGDTMS